MTDSDPDIDLMNEEEYFIYKQNLIKDFFTLDDFLSCEKTKNYLVDDFNDRWEKIGQPKIESFYNSVREEMQNCYATPLFYDTTGEFSVKLTNIIFKYLKKTYDISIFHDSPDLADSLLRQYEAIQEAKKINKNKQNKNKGTGIQKNKKFDWTTKTYK